MMSTAPGLSQIGALVGDPGRANMLDSLLDGRALTATELATVAGISPATASGHLAKLLEGGLLSLARQGRHRYYRIASEDVGRMLEAILVVASRENADRPDAKKRATPRISPDLREARTCYDHLAGRVAVALADSLIARGAVVVSSDSGEVTPEGRTLLSGFGIDAHLGTPTRRLFCRPCLDWSERRPHLAGVVGAAICARCEELGWIARKTGSREVAITPAGKTGFSERFGVPF